MEFENWQVSSTMRELVRQENVKHELSLLAEQQEKVRIRYSMQTVLNVYRIFSCYYCRLLLLFSFQQKVIEDQNSKRQFVVDIYNMIQSTTDWCRYYWIPNDWLTKWLSMHSTTDGIPPIDNSTLMCSHQRLDPLKVNRVKCVPATAAEILYEKYRGGPRLDQTSLCEVCVKRRCKLLRFKQTLERDHKEVSELVRTFKEP